MQGLGDDPLSDAIQYDPLDGLHGFRKTLVKWADRQYPGRDAFKVVSQNIGHESELTTAGSCLMVLHERQGELIKGPQPARWAFCFAAT